MKDIKIVHDYNDANLICHSGLFHADDVMATVILSKIIDDEVRLYRTFEVPEDINENTIVYDIGFGELDHHQKGGNGVRENNIPYAASGLVWKKFGLDVVKDTCDNPDFVWREIDKLLIQGIDAYDNGIRDKNQYPTLTMNISQAILAFNPNWDSEESSEETFIKAFYFADTIFENLLKKTISKVKAKNIVEDAIKKSDGRIMILDKFVPWQGHVYNSSNSKANDILFTIFPSSRGGYNFQCIQISSLSHYQRKKIPREWWGLRNEKLQELTGVKTAIFCHKAGFVAGAETLDDTIKMAELAIES